MAGRSARGRRAAELRPPGRACCSAKQSSSRKHARGRGPWRPCRVSAPGSRRRSISRIEQWLA
eukprot:2050810-Alexandrium_andersonii.AAC.1